MTNQAGVTQCERRIAGRHVGDSELSAPTSSVSRLSTLLIVDYADDAPGV